jgi:hypothetical protein
VKRERERDRHVGDKEGVVCTGAPLSAISGTTRNLDLSLLGGLQAKSGGGFLLKL